MITKGNDSKFECSVSFDQKKEQTVNKMIIMIIIWHLGLFHGASKLSLMERQMDLELCAVAFLWS